MNEKHPTPEALAMAERIRRWREHHRMSKKTLATMLGMDPSTVTGWEKGKTPGHSSIVAIAGAFGVSVGEFFRRLPDEDEAA